MYAANNNFLNQLNSTKICLSNWDAKRIWLLLLFKHVLGPGKDEFQTEVVLF